MSKIYFKINSIFLLHRQSPYITALKDGALRRGWVKLLKDIQKYIVFNQIYCYNVLNSKPLLKDKSMEFNQTFLNDIGVINVSLSEYVKEAQDMFADIFLASVENGSNIITPNVTTIIVDDERFRQFLQDNPDFYSLGDTAEFNWSALGIEEVNCDIIVYRVEDEFFLLCY